MINCMSNGKGMIIHLIVGLRKKNLYKNEFKSFRENINVKVDWSN